MKKILLILLIIPICAFADDCSNAYMSGLELYRQGNYIEAQQKFIAVAKVCGNYSDVFKMLKDCNAKSANQQKQSLATQKQNDLQIKNLKTENQQLKAAKETAETKYNDLLKKSAAKVNEMQNELDNTKNELIAAQSDINTLKEDTTAMHSKISTLLVNNDELQTALDECVLDTAANNNDIKALKKELKKLTSENNTLQKKNEDLEKKNEKLHQWENELKQKIDALNEEIKLLKKK